MKRNIIVGVLSGFFGSALLLILLSATDIVGARSADVRSDVASSDPASPGAQPARLSASRTWAV
jgi:hypothetical protein